VVEPRTVPTVLAQQRGVQCSHSGHLCSGRYGASASLAEMTEKRGNRSGNQSNAGRSAAGIGEESCRRREKDMSIFRYLISTPTKPTESRSFTHVINAYIFQLYVRVPNTPSGSTCFFTFFIKSVFPNRPHISCVAYASFINNGTGMSGTFFWAINF